VNDETPQLGEEKTPESKPSEEKKPRQATTYLAMVKQDKGGLWKPLMDGDVPVAFQGYKRSDVLQDIVDGDFGVEVQEDGYTPYIAIVPLRSFVALRAKIETRKSVVVAED